MSMGSEVVTGVAIIKETVLASSSFGPADIERLMVLIADDHTLYGALRDAGAEVLLVPSAFMPSTGAAGHWEVLLRARAIETGAFVIAPAQTGSHPRGRQTYGHSLIVSPWGEVLADGGEEPGVVIADLDLAAVDRARSAVPSLYHDRGYAAPPPARADIKGAE